MLINIPKLLLFISGNFAVILFGKFFTPEVLSKYWLALLVIDGAIACIAVIWPYSHFSKPKNSESAKTKAARWRALGEEVLSSIAETRPQFDHPLRGLPSDISEKEKERAWDRAMLDQSKASDRQLEILQRRHQANILYCLSEVSSETGEDVELKAKSFAVNPLGFQDAAMYLIEKSQEIDDV
ncbi:hypothetical protein [Salipiger sp. PrR007]|uniref:hypothetical protein n=1 Tax=Salipiger sp. PrR007 TaxID=2706884 RepID=UPI0013BBF417|nr:hypothetical protein [Salipiger sp. PrR007]NDW31893.1 hypothetical protein [Salipiger sp. PrR007]